MEDHENEEKIRRAGPLSPPAETIHEPEGDTSPPRRSAAPLVGIGIALVLLAALVIALVVAAVRAA